MLLLILRIFYCKLLKEFFCRPLKTHKKITKKFNTTPKKLIFLFIHILYNCPTFCVFISTPTEQKGSESGTATLREKYLKMSHFLCPYVTESMQECLPQVRHAVEPITHQFLSHSERDIDIYLLKRALAMQTKGCPWQVHSQTVELT